MSCSYDEVLISSLTMFLIRSCLADKSYSSNLADTSFKTLRIVMDSKLASLSICSTSLRISSSVGLSTLMNFEIGSSSSSRSSLDVFNLLGRLRLFLVGVLGALFFLGDVFFFFFSCQSSSFDSFSFSSSSSSSWDSTSSACFFSVKLSSLASASSSSSSSALSSVSSSSSSTSPFFDFLAVAAFPCFFGRFVLWLLFGCFALGFWQCFARIFWLCQKANNSVGEVRFIATPFDVKNFTYLL